MKDRRDRLVSAAQSFDANGDGKLDESERAAFKAAVVERYKAKRAAVKAKYDTNADGKLDESELSALKADIRARFESLPPNE